MAKAISILFVALLFASLSFCADPLDEWTARERGLIDGLRLDHLGEPPADSSNRFSADPKAAALGEKLFNDTRFSSNGKVSCATCHKADYNFTDDLRVAEGVGKTKRRTMPLAGLAHQTWFFWDGRNDSLWSQALGPLVAVKEHNLTRAEVAQRIFQHYAAEYKAVIGPLPEIEEASFAAKDTGDVSEAQWNALTEVYVNGGKAIAAFVRTIQPSPSPFDEYARALNSESEEGLKVLTDDQKKGLRLFITKAKCINCHNGPLFSNGEFHNVGTPQVGEPDRGRAGVIETLTEDEFNCLSQWSDANPETDCDHLLYLTDDLPQYELAFKTPSLRNVSERSPFMHAGQFNTLEHLIQHYQMTSGRNGVDEIFHSGLSSSEHEQLVAFLEALSSVE